MRCSLQSLQWLLTIIRAQNCWFVISRNAREYSYAFYTQRCCVVLLAVCILREYMICLCFQNHAAACAKTAKTKASQHWQARKCKRMNTHGVWVEWNILHGNQFVLTFQLICVSALCTALLWFLVFYHNPWWWWRWWWCCWWCTARWCFSLQSGFHSVSWQSVCTSRIYFF